MTHPATCSFSEFARIRRCRPGYVTELRKAGRLVLTDDGKQVRVAESIALIEATKDPAKQGVVERHAAARPEPAEPPADDEELPDVPPDNTHAQRRAKALADKEEELAAKARRENLVEMGKLLDRGEVCSVSAAAASTFRVQTENMISTLSPQLVGHGEEATVRALLTEHFEQLLREIEHQLGQWARDAA